MKKIRFAPLIILFVISGCCHICRSDAPVTAQVPVPTGYHLSTQFKMQAMHHWGLLAEDVAEMVKERMAIERIKPNTPVHVAQSGTASFEKAFRELLITRLVEKGIAVSDDPSFLLLSTDIQMVTHARKTIRTSKGVYKSLAPGLYVKRDIHLAGPGGLTNEAERFVRSGELNTEAGVYTIDLPETEIMITASLTKNDKYVMRNSSIYYIDDSEWRHYKNYPADISRRPSVVNYYLVGDGEASEE